MNKYKYILLILGSLLICSVTLAQVTVGSTNKPSEFSALQLDGVSGGLRLPQLSPSKMTDLNIVAGDEIAKGLSVYNTQTNRMMYWDGSGWATASIISASNGLKYIKGVIKLGGKLNQPTAIDLNSSRLEFITGLQKFSIHNNVLNITSRSVTFNPSQLLISPKNSNNYLLATEGNAVRLNTDGTGKFEIVGDEYNRLSVADDRATIVGSMMYNDGINAPKENDVLLAADVDGLAQWAALRPHSKIKTGTLISSSSSLEVSNAADFVNITAAGGELELTPGKWLVFLNFTSTSSARGYNAVWGHLRASVSNITPNNHAIAYVSSAMTTIKVDNSHRAFPAMVCLIDTDEYKQFFDGEVLRIYATAGSLVSGAVFAKDQPYTYMAISIVDYNEL